MNDKTLNDALDIAPGDRKVTPDEMFQAIRSEIAVVVAKLNGRSEVFQEAGVIAAIDKILDFCTFAEVRYRELIENQRRSALILKTVIEANSSLDLDETLTSAATSIAEAVGLPHCGIYLTDDSTGNFVMMGGAGRLNEAIYQAVLETPVASDDPLFQTALASEAPVEISDARNSHLIDGSRKESFGFKSLLMIPLRVRGKMLGVAIVPSFEHQVEFNKERVDIANGIAQAVAMAIDNARLFHKSQKLAVIEERNRLAQEIHDGLAQRLTGVVLQLEAAELLLQERPGEAEKRINRAKELARESLEEARRSVWDLRPKPLEEHSIVMAIRREVDLLTGDMDIQASFKVTGKIRQLSDRVENVLLRITQESLGNVRHHAHAKTVEVFFAFTDTVVSLTIIDDGVGFDPSDMLEQPDGHGLLGLKGRAKGLGGRCWIESAPGHGTQVQVKIPVTKTLAATEDI